MPDQLKTYSVACVFESRIDSLAKRTLLDHGIVEAVSTDEALGKTIAGRMKSDESLIMWSALEVK